MISHNEIQKRLHISSCCVQSPRNSSDNSNFQVARSSRPPGNHSAMLSNIPNILDPVIAQEEGGVGCAVLADIPDFTHADVCEDVNTGGMEPYGKLQRFGVGEHLPLPTDAEAARGGSGMGGRPFKISPPRSLPFMNDSPAQYDVINTPKGKGAGPHAATPVSRKVVKNPDYEEIDSLGNADSNSRLDKSSRVPLPKETSGPPVTNRQMSHPQQEPAAKMAGVGGAQVYGKLDHCQVTSPVCAVDGNMLQDTYSLLHRRGPDSSSLHPPCQEEYGELNIPAAPNTSTSSHPFANSGVSTAKVKGYDVLQSRVWSGQAKHHRNRHSTEEEYGRLSHKPSQFANQEAGGHGVGNSSSGGFNPYGTMPKDTRMSTSSTTSVATTSSGDFDDIIEEEFSTPIYNIASTVVNSRNDRGSRSTLEGTPPPGYETLSSFSKVASSQNSRSPSQDMHAVSPQRPVPAIPSIPPHRTASGKRRYENVDPNGKVLPQEISSGGDNDMPLSTQAMASKPDGVPTNIRRYENVDPHGEVLVDGAPEASAGISSDAQVSATPENPPSNNKKPVVKARTAALHGDSSTPKDAVVTAAPPSSDNSKPQPAPKPKDAVATAAPPSSDDSKPQPAPKPKVRPKPRNVESTPK